MISILKRWNRDYRKLTYKVRLSEISRLSLLVLNNGTFIFKRPGQKEIVSFASVDVAGKIDN